MEKKNVIDEKSINDVNYEQLKKLFPHAVSIDEEGKYSIDAQKLQMSLDPSKANIREDGYGLNWVGKKEAYHKAFAKNYKVLKPLNDDNSKHWDTTDNILIKGDNLDALKILRQNYFESVKMIYIDPPYNTKNDGFVYNDNFTTNTEETLEELGYDKEYIDYIENIQGAKTHSGWLSFMYPRLLLAKDLLKEDGVIFISIDDNEVKNLRLICDEIFGEGNSLAQFIWKRKAGGGDDSSHVAIEHEYILCYGKNKIFTTLNNIEHESPSMTAKYNKVENGRRYYLERLDKTSLTYSQSMDYYITCPDGTSIKPPQPDPKSPTTIWRWSEDKVVKNKNLLEFIKDKKTGEWRIYTKTWESLNGVTPRSLLVEQKHGRNRDGSQEVSDLLGSKIFSNPKPTRLLQHLIQIATNENDIILDFFAGSGSTAHSVMRLNQHENKNLKFIAVQWNEKTSEKSVAKNNGYDTIFDITKERITRAGDKIAKEHDAVDVGFRTFEVVEDLKQKIYQKPLEETDQKDLLAFTQSVVESTEDILYNLLVAESLPLSTKIETLIEEKLYLANNVALVLGNVNIDTLIEVLKPVKALEYITVYSPNVSDDKFTLECESAVSSMGIKPDKLRFRG